MLLRIGNTIINLANMTHAEYYPTVEGGGTISTIRVEFNNSAKAAVFYDKQADALWSHLSAFRAQVITTKTED